MPIFIFLNFFFFCPNELLYQKLGFQGRKCGQGDNRLKVLHASGIRNRALKLLCRDILGFIVPHVTHIYV